uniref:Uncharacterized protein n=1 Tax=Caenorhabditis japonica TaxID=281687 RepID=A0A8R1IE35_CAEJA
MEAVIKATSHNSWASCPTKWAIAPCKQPLRPLAWAKLPFAWGYRPFGVATCPNDGRLAQMASDSSNAGRFAQMPGDSPKRQFRELTKNSFGS